MLHSLLTSPLVAVASTFLLRAAMVAPSLLDRCRAWWTAMSWNSTSRLFSWSLSWLLMMPTPLYTRNLLDRPAGEAPDWKAGCSLTLTGGGGLYTSLSLFPSPSTVLAILRAESGLGWAPEP